MSTIKCHCDGCQEYIELEIIAADLGLMDLCEGAMCDTCIEIWRIKAEQSRKKPATDWCPVGQKHCDIYELLGHPCKKQKTNVKRKRID
jgi:hypothetical protein